MNSSRRDALPLWVALLLAFFFILRVVDVASLKPTHGANDATMQDLISSDLTAKTAYLESLRNPSPVVKLDPAMLHQALTAALTLQKESDNQPGAARRVIILRALVQAADPPMQARKDIAPLATGKNHLDPLAAFGTALPADLDTTDRAAFAQEGRIWRTTFGGTALTPRQLTVLAAQIQAIPDIRWWRWPALSALYHQQGDLSLANRYALSARSRTATPLVMTILLGLLRLALGLAGVLILIYLMVKAYTKAKPAKDAPPIPDLWPTVPERQPFSERKLGAGDLMAVFVIYLVTREVLEIALAGFGGIGHRHFLGFPGLLSSFLASHRGMPEQWRVKFDIILDAVLYVLSAVPPLAYLWTMARKRGASLADEIGWTRRSLGANAGYGVAGYAVATPLMYLIVLFGPHLFRHAPAPSNPVIPEMMLTSGFWTTTILIVLASVAAPLVEELLFRGVFYNSAKLLVGTWPAIILTGLVFGFMHPVGIAEMMGLALLGGVFAWMAETRKSLVPSMTAHCINNLTTTLILLFALSG